MAWFGGGDGIYRAVFKATHDVSGDTQVNTLHYRFHNAGLGNPDNDPQSLADALEAALFLDFAALYIDDWTISPVVVIQEKDPLNPTEPRGEWTSGTASFGDMVASADLPRACTSVTTLRSNAIGRRSTGRLFLGGSTSESEQSEGQWQASALTRWQAFLDDIPREPDVATGASESECHWVVYSPTNRAQSVTQYAFDIQSVQLRTAVHWLRSRATG